MTDKHVGVLGANSLVGVFILPLLVKAGWRVTAYSRQAIRPFELDGYPPTSIAYRRIGDWGPSPPTHWICVAPIWTLADYHDMLEAQGAVRVVALSSTSRFTKTASSDSHEQSIAQRLIDAEIRLENWAVRTGIEYVILRPTLIYGRGRDRNISEVARFIHRFGFFPMFGRAQGLRQPIHAGDVARACIAALESGPAVNRAYNISGGEVLSYRDMVTRTFHTLDRPPRMVTIPLQCFRLAIACVRRLPRYRHWSAAMAERMNQDLVFDHRDAQQDLNFWPRPFLLAREDLPTLEK